jgi:hypothetical protein
MVREKKGPEVLLLRGHEAFGQLAMRLGDRMVPGCRGVNPADSP